MFVEPAELEVCHGDPEALRALLTARLASQ